MVWYGSSIWLCPCMMSSYLLGDSPWAAMEALLRASISRRPGANGLAIIVANEKSCKEEHKLLCGVAQDLLAMKWAFEYLVPELCDAPAA